MTYAKSCPNVSVPSTKKRLRLRSREWPRPPRRDPHLRLIAQLTELAGTDSSVIATSTRPWASATFVGAKHMVALRFHGQDHSHQAARFSSDLPEWEFHISGHIVADACIDGCEVSQERMSAHLPAEAGLIEEGTTVTLSVLTIEEW